MTIDMSKLRKQALSNSRKIIVDFTAEEIEFMAYIFNTIINSDNYDTIIEYLAGINCMSISDIKFIRNIYCYYFASKEEKKVYFEKMKQIRSDRRKRGFIDLSVLVTTTLLIFAIGITLALLLYN